MAGATGVAAAEAEEAWLVPIPFVAVTVQVYPVPFERPATRIGELDAVPENAPGSHVAVYPVMIEPPFATGGVNDTASDPFPGVAVPIVGAAGGVL